MLRPEKLSDLVGGGQRGSGPGWCTAPGARLCLSSHCRGQGLRALARNCPRRCVYTTEIGKHCKSVLCFLSPSVLASTGGSSGKEPACQCRRRKRCGFDPWVGKIPLEEGMATHSSILAWEIPWTEEPGGLQSIGWPRVGHD